MLWKKSFTHDCFVFFLYSLPNLAINWWRSSMATGEPLVTAALQTAFPNLVTILKESFNQKWKLCHLLTLTSFQTQISWVFLPVLVKNSKIVTDLTAILCFFIVSVLVNGPNISLHHQFSSAHITFQNKSALNMSNVCQKDKPGPEGIRSPLFCFLIGHLSRDSTKIGLQK